MCYLATVALEGFAVVCKSHLESNPVQSKFVFVTVCTRTVTVFSLDSRIRLIPPIDMLGTEMARVLEYEYMRAHPLPQLSSSLLQRA